MTDRERFISICRALWGEEWHRMAAAHLGKARRTIVYWANGEYEPREWGAVFLSLLGCCAGALTTIQQREAVITDFKRTYPGGGR